MAAQRILKTKYKTKQYKTKKNYYTGDPHVIFINVLFDFLHGPRPIITVQIHGVCANYGIRRIAVYKSVDFFLTE